MSFTRTFSSLVFASFVCGSLAFAAAPKSSGPNPGFYHFPLGSYDVTTISDGFIRLPATKQLAGLPEKSIGTILKKNFLPDEVETSINTFLVNTGSKLVLIDTGAGKIMGPTGGHLLENLKAAGYQPEQIDAVLITHVHPDHIGGLTVDGKMTFPKATLFVDQKDIDLVTDPQSVQKAPKDLKPFYDYAAANITPYQKAGRLSAFTGGEAIVPGVHSLPTYGHTPGHNGYVIESEGQKLALVGDLLHVGSVQFESPSVGMAFDADKTASGKSRLNTLQEAAKSGEWIGAAHLAFPGVGHVRKEKTGFSFVPANYQH
jgi:glyoxylase-like metal-dependent hydrolase (beta-lactamase superfamily II)